MVGLSIIELRCKFFSVMQFSECFLCSQVLIEGFKVDRLMCSFFSCIAHEFISDLYYLINTELIFFSKLLSQYYVFKLNKKNVLMEHLLKSSAD